MDVPFPQAQPGSMTEREPIINDFSITAATVNGSGSQTANNTLIRAIHKMGVPVSGKNLFPSNIQGLPTWFTIRVSKDGYIARRERVEILVAMNKVTIAEDIQKLESGGVCLYPIDDPLPIERDDITYYPMPVNELVRKSGADARHRDVGDRSGLDVPLWRQAQSRRSELECGQSCV
jgi:2-oxoglutarate ferredoxin oxidoreductase subunit alpha